MRKRILKHAFVILTVAFVIGLVTGFAHGAHSPLAKAWLVSHVSGILAALIMSVVALLWSDLRLGPRAARVLYWATVPANYAVMAILGVVVPAMGAAPPIAAPEVPPPAGAAATLTTVGIVLATVSSFMMAGLVLYGLRGSGPRDE